MTRRIASVFAAWLALGAAWLALATVLAVPASGQARRSLNPASKRIATPFVPGARLLYVWDNDIPGDAVATSSLVSFATSRAIDVIAIECSPVGYGHSGAVQNYTLFVQALHAVGIEVFALNGYPWFTVPNGAGIPGQPTGYGEGWSVYQTAATSTVPFDGILDDSEPYSVTYFDAGEEHNWFWENLPGSAQAYLDWLHGIRARIGTLPLYSTIPYWYDEKATLKLALEGETSAHPLNWYVSRIVDVVNVLAYRDHAYGSGGMLAHAEGELATGPVIVGVNTCDISAASATFWEEGRAYMELQLLLFALNTWSHPHLRGFAIHDYGCYSTMRR